MKKLIIKKNLKKSKKAITTTTTTNSSLKSSILAGIFTTSKLNIKWSTLELSDEHNHKTYPIINNELHIKKQLSCYMILPYYPATLLTNNDLQQRLQIYNNEKEQKLKNNKKMKKSKDIIEKDDNEDDLEQEHLIDLFNKEKLNIEKQHELYNSFDGKVILLIDLFTGIKYIIPNEQLKDYTSYINMIHTIEYFTTKESYQDIYTNQLEPYHVTVPTTLFLKQPSLEQENNNNQIHLFISIELPLMDKIKDNIEQEQSNKHDQIVSAPSIISTYDKYKQNKSHNISFIIKIKDWYKQHEQILCHQKLKSNQTLYNYELYLEKADYYEISITNPLGYYINIFSDNDLMIINNQLELATTLYQRLSIHYKEYTDTYTSYNTNDSFILFKYIFNGINNESNTNKKKSSSSSSSDSNRSINEIIQFSYCLYMKDISILPYLTIQWINNDTYDTYTIGYPLKSNLLTYKANNYGYTLIAYCQLPHDHYLYASSYKIQFYSTDEQLYNKIKVIANKDRKIEQFIQNLS